MPGTTAAPLTRMGPRYESHKLILNCIISTRCVDALQLQRGPCIDTQVVSIIPTSVATTANVATYRIVAYGDFTRSPRYPALAQARADSRLESARVTNARTRVAMLMIVAPAPKSTATRVLGP